MKWIIINTDIVHNNAISKIESFTRTCNLPNGCLVVVEYFQEIDDSMESSHTTTFVPGVNWDTKSDEWVKLKNAD